MTQALMKFAVALTLCVATLGAQNPTPTPTYFPREAFADLKHSKYLDGLLEEKWFGSQLSGLGEPSLLRGSVSDEAIYRFTLLPSFSHPVSVRVTLHPDGTGTAITTIGKGSGGYAPKGILAQRSREVPTAEVNELKRILAASNLQSLPTEPNKQGGVDGTEWLMESKIQGNYHVVDRWEGGELRTLGLFLLQTVGPPGPEADLKSAIE